MVKQDKDLMVETPWGKVILAPGFETILRGFSSDLEKIRQAIKKINSRLDKTTAFENLEELQVSLESLGKRMNYVENDTLSRIKAVEESLQKTQTELRDFMDLTRNTLRLFKKKLDI